MNKWKWILITKFIEVYLLGVKFCVLSIMLTLGTSTQPKTNPSGMLDQVMAWKLSTNFQNSIILHYKSLLRLDNQTPLFCHCAADGVIVVYVRQFLERLSLGLRNEESRSKTTENESGKYLHYVVQPFIFPALIF